MTLKMFRRTHLLITTAAVLSLIGAVFLLPAHIQGQTIQSSWLKSSPPELKVINGDITASELPSNNTVECIPETKLVLIPTDVLKLRPEASTSRCAVRTAYGLHSGGDNYMELYGTKVAGNIKNSAGGTLASLAIPGSRHMLYSSGGLYGSNLYLLKDLASNITTTVQPDGSIVHQLKPGVVGSVIKDAGGNALEFSGRRFSDNGKWLVSDVPFRGMMRVNTETGETLHFQGGYNYAAGLRPKFVSAVSGDGRYVIVAEASYSILRIYDLSTCTPVSDISKPLNCTFRDLLGHLSSHISGFSGVTHLQFSTDHAIRIYASRMENGALRHGYYLLTASGEKESLLGYLALGDSFASGEGAFNYRQGTDVRNPFNKCHLSNVSYPFLLAARAGSNSVQSVACSGAKLNDVYSPSSTVYANSGSQSLGKESYEHDLAIFNGFLTGYRLQNDFVAINKPAKVTLSISGNDIGFGKLIQACLMPGTCYDSPQDRLDLAHTINSKFEDIVSTYLILKSSAGTGASIYVLGYPALAYPDGKCALNVHLDKQELLFANQTVSYLNKVIRQAAEKAGVHYIDIENAFTGKRLCEADSSELAVHGLTFGDDKTASIPLNVIDRQLDINITGRESYHPNQLGHVLLADAINDAISNLPTKPPGNHQLTAPAVSQAPGLTGLDISKLPPKLIIPGESIASNVLIKGQINNVRSEGFKPGTTVHATLKGYATTNLGSVVASSVGTVAGNVSVDDADPGHHILAVTGQNIAGVQISIQKAVYVAASTADIDGDGTENIDEKCLFIDSSGVDKDGDGVDDACDGMIAGELPDEPRSAASSFKTPAETDQNTNTASRVEPTSLATTNNAPNNPGTGSVKSKNLGSSASQALLKNHDLLTRFSSPERLRVAAVVALCIIALSVATLLIVKYLRSGGR